MATPLLSNAAASTITSGAASGAGTSITLADASKFPSPAAGQYVPASIVDLTTNPPTVKEIVYITAIAGNVLTITRGAESTSQLGAPGVLAVGYLVQNAYTVGAMNDLIASVAGKTTIARFNAYLTANQSISPTTWTKAAGWTVTDDPLSAWAASTNEYVCPVDGSYLVAGNGSLGAASASGKVFYVAVAVNGTRIVGARAHQIIDVSAGAELQYVHVVRCSAGDKISIWVYQNDTASQSLVGTATESAMSMQIQQLPDKTL